MILKPIMSSSAIINYQKYLDRVQKLKDEVALHEKNVAALQKELSGTSDPGKRNSGKN